MDKDVKDNVEKEKLQKNLIDTVNDTAIESGHVFGTNKSAIECAYIDKRRDKFDPDFDREALENELALQEKEEELKQNNDLKQLEQNKNDPKESLNNSGKSSKGGGSSGDSGGPVTGGPVTGGGSTEGSSSAGGEGPGPGPGPGPGENGATLKEITTTTLADISDMINQLF